MKTSEFRIGGNRTRLWIHRSSAVARDESTVTTQPESAIQSSLISGHEDGKFEQHLPLNPKGSTISYDHPPSHFTPPHSTASIHRHRSLKDPSPPKGSVITDRRARFDTSRGPASHTPTHCFVGWASSDSRPPVGARLDHQGTKTHTIKYVCVAILR